MIEYRYVFPKDFIRNTLLPHLKEIVSNYPYLAFILICSGIEFIGKCLDNKSEWDTYKEGLPKKHFNTGKDLVFQKYGKIKHNLYKKLRCGLLHSLLPYKGIDLRSREEGQKHKLKHLQTINGDLILIIEDLYEDFNTACEIIINKEYKDDDKMNKPFLKV